MERENVPYGVGSIFLYQPVKLLISAAQLDILTWQYVQTDSLLALAYRLYFSAPEAATWNWAEAGCVKTKVSNFKIDLWCLRFT